MKRRQHREIKQVLFYYIVEAHYGDHGDLAFRDAGLRGCLYTEILNFTLQMPSGNWLVRLK